MHQIKKKKVVCASYDQGNDILSTTKNLKKIVVSQNLASTMYSSLIFIGLKVILFLSFFRYRWLSSCCSRDLEVGTREMADFSIQIWYEGMWHDLYIFYLDLDLERALSKNPWFWYFDL